LKEIQDSYWRIYIYRAEDPNGRKWRHYSADKRGIKVAACTIADLNGDGGPISHALAAAISCP